MKPKKIKSLLVFIILPILPFISSCEKKDAAAGVTTRKVTNITTNSAETGGNVPTDGGNPVSAYGVCWATNSLPTLSDNKTVDGSGTGKFTSQLTGLQRNTSYYVRAYATNKIGTSYGSVVNFKTEDLPQITTSPVKNISQNLAQSGGAIPVETDAVISARGICWSTTQSPTLDNFFTTDGSGTGTFVSTISGLSVNTTYYVRAYATNELGTNYGNEIEFTTLVEGIAYDFQGNMYKTVIINGKEWMAENLRANRYNNGNIIPSSFDNPAWASAETGAYSIYNPSLIDGISNNADMRDKYGMLYNWHAVNDTRNICPFGWRIPTIAEWTELINFTANEGAKSLKSCRQINSPVGGVCATNAHPRWNESATFYGTNDTEFAALPAGMRYSSGSYIVLGEQGSFWTSSQQGGLNAWYVTMYNNNNIVEKAVDLKTFGRSVRCIKN